MDNHDDLLNTLVAIHTNRISLPRFSNEKSTENVLKAPMEGRQLKTFPTQPKLGTSGSNVVQNASGNVEMTLGCRLMILQNKIPRAPSSDDEVWKPESTFIPSPISKRNVQNPFDATVLLDNLVNIIKPVIPPPREKFTCSTCLVEMFVDEGRLFCIDQVNGASANGDTVSSNHSICIDCVRLYAAAVVEDSPLAAGGIGLRCCSRGCDNVFLASEFMVFLPEELHVRLEKRMQHESIMEANIADLVSCPCGYFLIVPHKQPSFDCISCGRCQCRHCPRPYDQKHRGKSCELLDRLDAEAERMRRIGPALNDVVVRVCPKCRLQCVKEQGCNHMTCRCTFQFCYLCRQAYSANHFCQCGGRTDMNQPCTRCGRTCTAGTNASVYDDVRLQQVEAQFRQS